MLRRFLVPLSTYFSIFSLLLGYVNGVPPKSQCNFPEASSQTFFFDIRADTVVGSVITDSVVDPADAQLRILDVRSNNLKGNFAEKFELEKRQSGQFLLVTNGDLNLPPYPSTLNETTLYLTIECNGHAHPLISIRIRNYNSHSPLFLNSPYELLLPQDTSVGSIIKTPILAIDEDPSQKYTISYNILNQHQNREFQIAPETNQTPIQSTELLPEPYRSRKYGQEQLPTTFQIQVVSPLRKKTYYLNVSASDNQTPPRQSSVLLKIAVGQQTEILPHFSQQEYYANFSRNFEPFTELILNQPIVAIFPQHIHEGQRQPQQIRYELSESKYSSLFELNPKNARLFLKQQPFGAPTETIELGVKAYTETDPEKTISAKITLNDISEVHLTYFAQCHYEVHLAENSLPNTKVAQFIVRGDIAGIDLLNGTEYFNVDNSGLVTVAKDAVIDYEEIDQIIITARLRSSFALHPKSLELCQIATVDIHIDDVNDHSPKFEKTLYTFYTDEYPFNNTEIGIVRASDEDKGIFGKVNYKILDEGIPFILFEADGVATIYYVSKSGDYFPEKSYTFTIEAFDSKEYPRTARVTIKVLLQPSPSTDQPKIEDSTISIKTTPIEKLTKPKKQFRTLGAVNVDNPQLNVEEQGSNDFGANSETFDGTEEKPQEDDQNVKTTEVLSKKTSKNLNFEQQNYNFTLDGKLDEGQYIGTVRLMQIEDEGEETNNDDDPIEYTVENGIKGFIKIDPQYGSLRLDSKLIEDSYEQIRFAAQARRNGKIVASTVISVFMNESSSIYAQDPRFEQALYRFEIEENQPGHVFAQVFAHHRAAELDKDHIWYTLNRDKDGAAFRIDPETGQLRSLEPFDAETKKFYSIKINACLESSTQRCAHAEAIVVIKDLNDNEPQFTSSTYSLKLPPDLSAGTDILQVQASDKDSGKLRYEILPSHASEYFKIDEQTGQIQLVKSFDKDLPSQLRVRLAVHDMGEPPLMGLAEVAIELTTEAKYSNEHAPEFDDFRYEFSKKVPIPEGTVVANVHATDLDEGDVLWYRFAEDTPISRKFSIDKKTGEIRTISQVGPEVGEPVQLLVEVHDSSVTFARKSDTVVLLHLLNENQERLEFLPLPKIVYISSAKPLGSTIFKAGLKNANFKNVHYTVEQDLRSEYFAMIDDLLVVQSKLRPGTYRITIKAQAIPNSINPTQKQMSIESHSLKMIVMTDRDKYPVFEKLSYELKISSNANFPIKLPAFNASVNEGRVTYSLYNADNLRGVKIDAITGELTIFEEFVDQVAEDLPRGMVFVVVRATNSDSPLFYSDVGVRLGLMSSGHELIFSSRLYRLITRENVSPGTVINTVKVGVLEPDLFPSVRYSMEPNDLFDIATNGSVVVKKELDLESLPLESKGIVEVTVVARHIGQVARAQVQIKIEDVNEFAPKFDQPSYNFRVDETMPPGTWIGKVHASDQDYNDRNSLTYRATLGNALGLINITSAGTLVLNPNAQFQPNQNYSLIVEATDSGRKTAEAAIHFQITDPNLNQPTPEPIQMPTEKWMPSSPEDKMMLPPMSHDGNWNFKIAEGNEMDRIFVEKVNKTTAQLGLKTEHLTSNSNKEQDLILLEITNLDDPFERLRTNISVDLNKVLVKKLEFVDQNKEIRLDMNKIESQNSSIFHVSVKGASAESKNDLRFELTENPLGIFRLDSKSGDLFVEWPLEQVIQGDHEILITVRLGKQSIQRVYVVKVSGEFKSKQESDKSGEREEKTTTKQALTTQKKPMETVDQSTSNSAEELTTIATQITVDSHEKEEIFGFELKNYTFEMENPKKGQVIGQLVVKGASGPVKLQIKPEAYQQWFGVNQTTDTLFVKDVPFELKGRQRAEFVVQAVDLENLKHRAQINVSVDLILPESSNEVESELTTNEFETTITSQPKEDLSTLFTEQSNDDHSTIVSNQQPSTPATFPHTQSSLSIEDQTPQTQSTSSLSIQSTTSTAEETVVFDSTPDFSPKNLLPTQTVMPDLLTNLPTENPTLFPIENTPTFHFKHQEYTAMLPERQYGNRGSVVNLKPAPLKEGLENVIFGIESQQQGLPFFIRNHTGELIAFDNIDREFVKEYKFNVTAQNIKDPSQKAIAQVKITILDVNDNYPVFENPTHVLPIASNSVPGTILGKFKASDVDEGTNGQITYRVAENYHNLFDINSKGELSLTTKITALPEDTFNITLIAIDGGRPALRSQHLLQIQIFADGNDQPAFHKSEYVAEVSRKAEKGSYVIQVVAGMGPMNYLILNDDSDLFLIDNRGLIQLIRKPIPAEQNRYHTLTVIAESPNGKTANTTVNVFMEGEPLVVTVTPRPTPPTQNQSTPSQTCQFTSKTYNTEIKENTPGKTKLTTIKSNCDLEKVKFTIHQATKEFELDEDTGDVYVVEPLDREKKGLHLVVVNITLRNEAQTTKRHRRQPATINPIAEFVKNKLSSNQALVLVKVLDENDNEPIFTRMTPDNQYVFTVDWQAPLLQPIARVQAVDPDEHAQIKYSISSNDFFIINETSGVIMVQRSLLNIDEEVFELKVKASDGGHETSVPLKIYKLAPGLNIAILTIKSPESDVDESQAARKLSQLLEKEVRVLVKQVYISEDGHADPKKTHLFIYAVDRQSKIPIDGYTLKSLLEKFNTELQKDEELPVSAISLPITSSTFHLTITEIILLGVSICLLLLACCMLFVLLRCCKRKTIMAKPDMSYMIGSKESHPRPYNVELISRKSAQNVLAARPLPDPYEEVTMSPESRSQMLASAGVYQPNHNTSSQRTISSTVTDEMPINTNDPIIIETPPTPQKNPS